MPAKTETDIAVVDDMRIPVRDGITLSGRVWMPSQAAQTPLPAILEILPYRKRDGTAARDATTHAVFCRHNYVCLRVDLRGCGESEGLFDDEYSKQELSDIEDVIAWISEQDWCSGSVGIMGISWGGFNGLQVAARRPPALKAVISLCSSVDRYADDIHYKGGCQLMENIGWTATAMSWFSMPPDPALVGEKWRDIWLERLNNTRSMMTNWLGHPSRDAYWKHASVCEDFSDIEAAVLILGGWHDGYRNTPVKLLEGGTSGPVKAIVGPWNHKYPHIAAPAPQMDFNAEALRWWDRWLKGYPTEVEHDPDYRLYLMDGIAPQTSYAHRPGRWVGLPNWPAPQISSKPMALGNGTMGQGQITEPVTVASDVRCGHGFGEFYPFGFGPGELPDDQRNDDAHSACFDTEILTEATSVVGAPTIRIKVSADTPYAQMAVRLCDVGPDGASALISLGVLNLQFRDGFDIAKELVPGKEYEVTLDLDQAAYEVPKGHRLRLALSASYWPLIWPERGPTELTILEGTLDLPILDDDTGLDWRCPPVTTASVPTTKVLREGREEKHWSDDDGRHTLVIHGDHGQVEHLDHGLRVSSEITETWSIDKTNISQAQSETLWTRAISRDDFEASSHIVTKMHSDSEAYHVTIDFKAYDRDECIFEKQFHETFRRDLTRQTQQ